jgi:protein-tyrosine phosphatase
MINEMADITEIPLGLAGYLWRSPMPFAPFDPLNQVWPAYQAKDVSVVVILTEKQEYLVHAKQDIPAFYRAAGLQVIFLPVPDHHAPRLEDRDAYDDALNSVEDHLRAGRNVAVHCLAGIGRTGSFIARLGRQILGMDGEAAIEWVRGYIPGAMESIEQEKFVLE